jgi:acrylyl-CoA reductase (NADPH)
MSLSTEFRAFRIHNDANGYRGTLETIGTDALSQGEVLVKVAYSSVNYKDALAGTGKGKILRHYPLNGGIDACGVVVASNDINIKEGDHVLCTGSGLSETLDGGLANTSVCRRVDHSATQTGLDLRESMILGTAVLRPHWHCCACKTIAKRPDWALSP